MNLTGTNGIVTAPEGEKHVCKPVPAVCSGTAKGAQTL